MIFDERAACRSGSPVCAIADDLSRTAVQNLCFREEIAVDTIRVFVACNHKKRCACSRNDCSMYSLGFASLHASRICRRCIRHTMHARAGLKQQR